MHCSSGLENALKEISNNFKKSFFLEGDLFWGGRILLETPNELDLVRARPLLGVATCNPVVATGLS
jgi:hypothetical protein